MSSRTSRFVFGVLGVFGVFAAASPARADKTPRLGELFRGGPEQAASLFESLSTDLATVIGPRRLGPSATTGPLGFDISLDLGVATVDESSAHWASALPGGDGVFTTVALQARKGLPYGFELGADAAHVVETDLWNVGINLKWAFLEGYKSAPDAALRVYLAGVVGARDFGMFMTGGDLTVSKAFGLGGVVAIAPYGGYSLVFARASGFVSGYFEEDADTPAVGVIPTRGVLAHRAVLGFRLALPFSSVSFEALISSGVQSYVTTVSLSL